MNDQTVEDDDPDANNGELHIFIVKQKQEKNACGEMESDDLDRAFEAPVEASLINSANHSTVHIKAAVMNEEPLEAIKNSSSAVAVTPDDPQRLNASLRKEENESDEAQSAALILEAHSSPLTLFNRQPSDVGANEKFNKHFGAQAEGRLSRANTTLTNALSIDNPLKDHEVAVSYSQTRMGAETSMPACTAKTNGDEECDSIAVSGEVLSVARDSTTREGKVIAPDSVATTPSLCLSCDADESRPISVQSNQGTDRNYHQVVKFQKRAAIRKAKKGSDSPLSAYDQPATLCDDSHVNGSEAINNDEKPKELRGSNDFALSADQSASLTATEVTNEPQEDRVTYPVGSHSLNEQSDPKPLHSPQPMLTEPVRVQTVVIKKKRTNECFADAKLDVSKFQKAESRSKAESKTLVISDPQNVAVSATVSLGTSTKISPQKPVECSDSSSSTTATFATPSSVPLPLEEPISTSPKLVSTLPTRPVLVVHPAQKSLSSCALNSYSTLPTAPHSKNSSTSTLCSNSILSPTTTECPSNTSTPNSFASRGSKSSDEMKETFANKLGKGFFDLTQGSSDRLQRWKIKLQSGRRHKDTSEPPPVVRKMPPIREPTGHSSDAEMMVDWSPAKLNHPQLMRANKFECASSAFTAKITRPRILQPTRSVSDIAQTSATQPSISLTDSEMEHRTLRQRDENSSKTVKNLAMHYQNMKNLQHLVHTAEGFDNSNNNLPPPARITPYSGMKPQDSDIIRPVAFRPFVAKRSEVRQSATSTSSFYTKHCSELPKKRTSSAELSKRLSQEREVASMAPTNSRPRGIYQPSTSSEASSCASLQYPAKLPKPENEENDYDVVPEYIDRDKLFADDSGSSDNYSVLYSSPPQSATLSRHRCVSQTNNNAFQSFASSVSSSNIVKKSPPSQQVCGSNGSNSSRHSSGVHITPSPSDSGIVDYESIIRDKENELSNVRTTMEHNEEIVIRVYQEKERIWKEQLADLKQKLLASQQGENALRQQIQRCNEQRDQFQATIQNLTSDKQGLQRKCLQIEREMFQIRERFDELMRSRENSCESCRRKALNADAEKGKRVPVPAPRQNKDSPSDRELRAEVDQLKAEVSTLRDTLTEQIGLFANERKKWEQERVKILKSNSELGNSSEPKGQSNRNSVNGKQCVISRDRLI